ncbi:MAG: UDP-N-acetylmuramoyl-tripeptide--D-alanyl-D-alanine ligase [Alkalispirochaeta sp.]
MGGAVGSSNFPTLHELSSILSASPPDCAESVRPTSVCIDSRTCAPGALFCALPGEQTDGHHYVVSAAQAGACGAIVRDHISPSGDPWPIPVLVVPDALQALHEVAAWYATHHLSGNTTRIGVTGSNGKTTTKEMIAAILRDVDSCFVSTGNLNSETGLPLSVCETPPGVRYAVYELAMSRPGEIAPLARIVRPHHAVITHIGTAHIGNLGSQQAIAAEKKQITAYFTGAETLYIPEDDDFRDVLAAEVAGAVVTTGPVTQHASLETDPTDHRVIVRIGSRSATLPILGRHNGRNALIALAVTQKLGIDTDSALASLTRVVLPSGRSQRIEQNGHTIIHDAYNANPGSMIASIEMAEELGVTVLILGDMYELGVFEEAGHREVIQAALASSARLICFVGERFRAVLSEAPEAPPMDRVLSAPTVSEIAELVRPRLQPGETILLKGSRAVALEHVIGSFAEGGEIRA